MTWVLYTRAGNGAGAVYPRDVGPTHEWVTWGADTFRTCAMPWVVWRVWYCISVWRTQLCVCVIDAPVCWLICLLDMIVEGVYPHSPLGDSLQKVNTHNNKEGLYYLIRIPGRHGARAVYPRPPPTMV